MPGTYKVADHIDHVGSFMRPPQLLAAYRDYEDGKISRERLQDIQDVHIESVIAMQEAVKSPTVTDGEFRRTMWMRGFTDAVEGMEFKPGPFTFRNDEGVTSPLIAWTTSQKLRRSKPIVLNDYLWLKSHTDGTPKVTIPSPSNFHMGFFSRAAHPDVYSSIDEFFSDMIGIYREEIRELAAAGCTRIQIDDVPLAMLCDPENRKIAASLGEDPGKLIALYIDLIGQIVKGTPSEVTVGLHLCRGNRSGMWVAAGGYDIIAERLFNEIEVDRYLLEYDTSRAGTFEPLKYVPEGKIVHLGLMSTKNVNLESFDEVRAKVDEAAKIIPLERLGICPQCGFGSSASRYNPTENPMTESAQAQKMQRLVDIGHRLWG